MANPAQHGEDMTLVDEIDGGLPTDDANDEASLGKEAEDKELMSEE